jgi:hypothetical protein
MEQPDKNALRNLQRIAKFFVGFLGVMVTLLAAHYPLLPERMIGAYGEYAKDARMLAMALTMIGFAVVMAIASTPRIALLHVWGHGLSSKNILLWMSALLLMSCASGFTSASILVHLSTRIAEAVAAAEARPPLDRVARDFLSEVHDTSTGIVRCYQISSEYLEMEPPAQGRSQKPSSSPEQIPLQNSIAAVYVGTIVSFKLGLFCLASALYLDAKKIRKRRERCRGIQRVSKRTSCSEEMTVRKPESSEISEATR